MFNTHIQLHLICFHAMSVKGGIIGNSGEQKQEKFIGEKILRSYETDSYCLA